MWFPRLASDRALRIRPVAGPFALTGRENNAERLYCLNAQAEAQGLRPGMSLADARSYCPDLLTRPARPDQDRQFLSALRRWAGRYCPWVGYEGDDGLVLDITGTARLFGGEAAILDDMRARAGRAGLALRLGCAPTRGAAWALAHFGPDGDGATAASPHAEDGDGAGQGAGNALAPALAPALGPAAALLDDLPVAALRLDAEQVVSLQRLGLRRIGDLRALARPNLARRFGPELLLRLDQALGLAPEPITPAADPPHFATRLSLPEPIGLVADVMAATARLLVPLCARLTAAQSGARRLRLTLRRVDQGHQQLDLRLAAPMCDPARILPLFARGVGGLDAGFGIDQLRLEAVQVEAMAPRQIYAAADGRQAQAADGAQLDDLLTRIGTRIGLENVLRFRPADSHIPERSFQLVPAADPQPLGRLSPDAPNTRIPWRRARPRPLCLFAPEPVQSLDPRPETPQPPRRFRWRRMALSTARAIGPERIAPQWWQPEPDWRRGLRDYWRIDTREGRRLWLFYTPQDPGWFVQGEFP